MGTLCYSDNLDVFRRYLKDETVDLSHPRPLFKSVSNYGA